MRSNPWLCSRITLTAIPAAADAGQSDGSDTLLPGEGKRIPVATLQELWLPHAAAAPHGAGGMDHPFSLETEPGSELRFAGGTAMQPATGFQQLRACGPVDSPIYSAAAQ